MGKENPYQNIETKIREQLEIAKKSQFQNNILINNEIPFDEREKRLEKGLVELNNSVALKNVALLLQKLPKNYHAFEELNEAYLELIR